MHFDQVLEDLKADKPEQILVGWISNDGQPKCALLGNSMGLNYLLKLLEIQVTTLVSSELNEEKPKNLFDKN